MKCKMFIVVGSWLLLASLAFLCVNCASAQKVKKMESAEIKVNVISRGSYQYLVKVGDTLYLTEKLDDEFKEDGLKVLVSYKVSGKKGMVYKPSSTDIPEPDYQIEIIEIKAIKKQ